MAARDFGDGIRINASFGVAALLGERPLEQLFSAADAALYRAKSMGRNRVEAERPDPGYEAPGIRTVPASPEKYPG